MHVSQTWALHLNHMQTFLGSPPAVFRAFLLLYAQKLLLVGQGDHMGMPEDQTQIGHIQGKYPIPRVLVHILNIRTNIYITLEGYC